jgi:hypothetical protein
MRQADLPSARRPHVTESISFRVDSAQLACTCDITGSTKSSTWNGTPGDAEQLVDDLADETAFLISETPHYAWLRATR